MPSVSSYPVLQSAMTQSTDSSQQKTAEFVKATHSYVAHHRDELTIQPGLYKQKKYFFFYISFLKVMLLC
jgi:hypothetical protein